MNPRPRKLSRQVKHSLVPMASTSRWRQTRRPTTAGRAPPRGPGSLEPVPLSRWVSPWALGTILSITAARQIRGRRLVIFSMLFALPILFAVLAHRFADPYVASDAETVLIFGLIPQALLPLTALLYRVGNGSGRGRGADADVPPDPPDSQVADLRGEGCGHVAGCLGPGDGLHRGSACRLSTGACRSSSPSCCCAGPRSSPG